MTNSHDNWKYYMDYLKLDFSDIFSADLEKTIKSQYRKLSKLYHPDKNKSFEAKKHWLDLSDSFKFFGDQNNIETVKATYISKIHDCFSKYFPHADHSVESYTQDHDHIMMLGEVFTSFGEMDHFQ